MGFAPVPDSLHVVGIAEVVAVLWFAQPPFLAVSLAGPLALHSRAILLAFSIPVIGHKQLLTVPALATMRLGLHQIKAASPKTSVPRRQAGIKLTPEEDGKTREEELLRSKGEEKGAGRRPHFQTARITAFSACRRDQLQVIGFA
jgi:hypothetical protein